MLVKRISCAMQDLDHMISSDMGLCGVVIAAELTLPTQQMSSQIDHTRARRWHCLVRPISIEAILISI